VNVHQQHVSQLRTFFHLEQISVLRHLNTVGKAKRIKYDIDEGFSFCFHRTSFAWHFVKLIAEIVPVRFHFDMIPPESERYLFRVEIVPICCGDLIFLPPNVAASFGVNIGPIVICTRVTKTFTLLEPFTLTHCFLKADQYWNAPFTPSFNRTQLVEYVVLDILLPDNEEEEDMEENKEEVKKEQIIEDENDDDADAADDAAAKKYV